jgi:clan AA aspartic protease (TIGR02281 family)
MTRTIAEAEHELSTFMLVLGETQGRAVTLTQLDYTLTHAGVYLRPISERLPIRWKLRPHGELRQLFYATAPCPGSGCTALGRLAPRWHILLTGTDDQGQTVRVAITLAVPPPPSGEHRAPPPQLGTTLPLTAVKSGVVDGAVPFATMSHTVLVHAMLNHREPATFLLDTGATRTLLTPDMARRLGISPAAEGPRNLMAVLSGQRLPVPLVDLSSLAVGNVAVEDLQVGVFAALPHAPFIDGLLGSDFLKRFTMTLDYARSRLWLTPQPWLESLPFLPTMAPPAVYSTVPIETRGGHILVRALLNHTEPVTLLLDTGATHTMLTPETARRLGLQPASHTRTGALQVVGGQQIRFPLVPLAALSMGEAMVENMSVGILAVAPGTHPIDGLLGGDFLEHFTLTLDYRARQLQLALAPTAYKGQLVSAPAPVEGLLSFLPAPGKARVGRE